MNRLVELADSLHTIARYLIPLGNHGLAEIAEEAAARLAVANAKAERDAARRELDEQKHGHACAMATLAEERDALQRERDEARDECERLRTTDCVGSDYIRHEAAALRKLLAGSGHETHAIDHITIAHAKAAKLIDKNAALQRAIDEAYTRWLLSSEMSTTSDSMARVLCPHATRRDGQQADRPQCPTNLTVTQGKVPTREEVMGADHAKVAAFKESLNKASEIVSEWPEWKKRYCQSPPTVAQNATVAAATPAATPQAAGVSTREMVAMAMVPHMFNQMCHGIHSGQFGWPEDWRRGLVADAFKFADEFIAEAERKAVVATGVEGPTTRELVARLAVAIRDWASLPDPVMHSCVPDVDAIIADARRGGAE